MKRVNNTNSFIRLKEKGNYKLKLEISKNSKSVFISNADICVLPQAAVRPTY